MATASEEKTMKAGFFNGASEVVKTIHQMGADAQKNADLLEQETKEFGNVTFFWNRINYRWEPLRIPLPEDQPYPERLSFFTLGGMIDYIQQNVEGLLPNTEQTSERLMLQVVNEMYVVLWSKPSTFRRDRHIIAEVTAHTPKIYFDSYIGTDEFNTMLLSKFVGTPARDELFKVIKSLTNEQSMNTADDGVSQVFTVKQGVSLASNCQFKNPVPLAPIRTFTEVIQPESNFTLRVNDKANVALFEADGGAWKNEAVALVKEYLRSNLEGYPVVVIA